MLNSNIQSRWDIKRPEVIIPLGSEDSPPLEAAGPVALEEGRQVRVVRAPYTGSVGTVTHLPALPQAVESGARLLVAEVEFDDDERALIPLANLELIH
jgi:hypothetical protein